MADAKPVTAVLIHGAFADGSAWSRVIPHLHARGLGAIAVQNPLTSLVDDVAATNRAIAVADGPVVLVGHSWGGAVITEAGLDDRVIGLVYVAALTPAAGQSCNDIMKAYPTAPALQKAKADAFGFVSLPPDVLAEDFAQDLPASETAIMAATQGPVQAQCFATPLTKTAWASRPSWFIVASQDRTLDPQLLRDSAKRINAKTVELATGHVPQLSKPAEVAAVIIEAAAAQAV
jgi:pimeloyl-ACP methyl ester carboxylesterase